MFTKWPALAEICAVPVDIWNYIERYGDNRALRQGSGCHKILTVAAAACSVSDIRPKGRIFTSAKSSQYVEILRQRRTKRSRIPEVTPWIQIVNVTLDGSNTAVIRKLAQSGEQWQSPETTLKAISPAAVYLRGDDTFGFSYRSCKWRCDHDDIITHSTRTAGL